MTRHLPSWIEAYLAYTAESESPEEYHRWLALSVIAGALRRRVYFDMSYFLLFPNLYIVLVGPAGRCKKSTAMRIGRAIGESVPGCDYSVDSTTRESLIMDMSQVFKDGQSALTVHSTEFASIMTSSGMDMVVFLTDVYDSPQQWVHKTKGGGTNKIKAPFLNLVGAATPEWLAKGLPTDVIGFGFTSRVVFIYQDTPRVRDPFPTLTTSQAALRDLLIEDLAQIALIQGQYQFNEDAKEMYRIWHRAHMTQPNPTGNPKLAGYYERKPMHLIKLCMVVAASKRDDLILTEEDLTQAMFLLDHAEENMPKVFSAVGRNPLYADQEQILLAIQSTEGGLTVGEIIERFGYNVRKEEVSEIVETLVSMNSIILGKGGKFYGVKRVSETRDKNDEKGP